MRKRMLLAAIISLSLLTLASAGDGKKKKGIAKKGSDVKARVASLMTEINWHRTVDAALAEARKENKLVFFLHTLGALDGVT